jgi:hypothetical protein
MADTKVKNIKLPEEWWLDDERKELIYSLLVGVR